RSDCIGARHMKGFNNLAMAAKLALSFGALLSIMIALGLFCVWRLSTVAGHAHELARNWLPSVEHLSEINTAKSDLRVAQLRYVTATTTEEAAQFNTLMRDSIGAAEEAKRLYVPLISDDTERGLWNEFDRQWHEYLTFSSRVTALWQEGKHPEA